MKSQITSYVAQRVLQFFLVIFIGITATFLIPRLSPTNPVDSALSRLLAYQTYMEPEAIEQMRRTLEDLYGLEGTVFQQYASFWGRLVQGDLGPSLSMYPRPVMDVIRISMPWTVGLLSVSTIVAWLLGVFLGSLSGYFSGRKWTRVLDAILLTIYPIPFFIVALVMLMLFTYILPIFPYFGGVRIGIRPSFTFRFFLSVLKHGILPAFCIVFVTFGWRFLGMKAMVSTVVRSDYVTYAEMAGLPKRKILANYVVRNSILPEITNLALSIGFIFSGAIVTEYVFSYPGIGQVLLTAIVGGDFTLIMGITIFSIIGVALAALLIDLLYPLFDPQNKTTLTGARMLIVARDLFLHDARFRFGSVAVLLIIGLVMASFFSPYEDHERLVAPKNRPPSFEHVLGTNAIGQDVFWRLTVALRNSLIIGIIATVLSRAVAIFVGLVAGYVGGKTDRLLSTIADGVIVLPRLPLLILLSFVFKARLSIPMMGIVLGALDWAQSSKQYRAQILSLREMGFTATARFSGMSPLKVVFGEHLPFLIPYVMAGFIMGIVWGIGAELTLAVIGLSDLLTPTIGTMVYWSNHYHAIMSNTWWWIAAPVGAAVLAVVALYWLSVSIGGYLDPRTRIQLKTIRS